MYRDMYFFDISNPFILQSMSYCIHLNFLILFSVTLDMYLCLMNNKDTLLLLTGYPCYWRIEKKNTDCLWLSPAAFLCFLVPSEELWHGVCIQRLQTKSWACECHTYDVTGFCQGLVKVSLLLRVRTRCNTVIFKVILLKMFR